MNTYTTKQMLQEDGTYLNISADSWERLDYSEGFWVGNGTIGVMNATASMSRMVDDLSHVAPGSIVGVWTDTSDSRTYVDISEHFHADQRSEAVSAAKSRNELAIWDIARNEEVRIAA